MAEILFLKLVPSEDSKNYYITAYTEDSHYTILAVLNSPVTLQQARQVTRFLAQKLVVSVVVDETEVITYNEESRRN